MAYKLSEKIVGGIVAAIRKILSFFPLKVRYSFFWKFRFVRLLFDKKTEKINFR